MNTVTWTRDMSLGLAPLDMAHASFLQQIERLAETGDDAFCSAFLELVARTERDFQEEEAMMEDIEYEGLCAHREQHARVLGALHHVASRVMAGDLAIGREAVALLPQWFVMHLSTMDTALALALELNASEPAAPLPVPPTP